MTIEQIKTLIQTDPSYSFLKTNEHLGDNIILLGVGGSHAYGTNVSTSDVDIRGVATLRPVELLSNANFEQVCNSETDTTIYSLNKIVSLLCSCNPNTIELLGLKPEHYLYITDTGRMLLDNKRLFLSKLCMYSFGGYANAQLRRLSNRVVGSLPQSKQEQHILNSIEHARFTFPEKYSFYSDDAIRLYLDESNSDDMDTEIFMDVHLTHYPLRDYKGMWAEMNNIVKDYGKLGHRNKNAIARDKVGKHMMHLVRLFLMCIDILEKHEIITYREAEHDLLMSIRNNEFLDGDGVPTAEFYNMVDALEARMQEAVEKSTLPEKPDYKAINELLVKINRKVVLEGGS